MSIIYDALNKVERSKGKHLNVRAHKSVRPQVYLILPLALLSGVFITNAFLGLFARRIKNVDVSLSENQDTAVITKPYPEDSPKIRNRLEGPLILNGVFISDNQSYALINNQVVKEGDVFEGGRILRISKDEVELQKDQTIIRINPSGSN